MKRMTQYNNTSTNINTNKTQITLTEPSPLALHLRALEVQPLRLAGRLHKHRVRDGHVPQVHGQLELVVQVRGHRQGFSLKALRLQKSVVVWWYSN